MCESIFPFDKYVELHHASGSDIFAKSYLYYTRKMRILGTKAGATFDTATLKDFLSRFRIIAFHKSVLDFALAFVWLVGSFWHNIILSM